MELKIYEYADPVTGTVAFSFEPPLASEPAPANVGGEPLEPEQGHCVVKTPRDVCFLPRGRTELLLTADRRIRSADEVRDAAASERDGFSFAAEKCRIH